MTDENSKAAAPALPRPDSIAKPLLAWYGREGRTLPWRDIDDPYRILVSEIMLQQTRVTTVLRYYPAFLERFPTLADLAAADQEDVLAAWSGLGFYRRARNLHACARQVVDRYDGEVPRDPEELGSLPGIGRYTVGAILSSAHNARLPILDGNVIRVLTRLFRIPGDPGTAAVSRRLWQLATDVLPQNRPGDFNQALMDLGATVCKPIAPLCEQCPLAGLCAVRAAGNAEDFPNAGRRTKVTFVQRVALFLEKQDGSFLLVRRPADGLLAGMWELPGRELGDGEAPERLASILCGEFGLTIRPDLVVTSEHRFSHRHWTTRVYRARVEDECSGPADASHWSEGLRWTCAGDLEKLAVPEASRKTLRPCLRASRGSLPG